MNELFQRLAKWQQDWDATPATLLLQSLRAEAALRPSLGVGECKTICLAIEQGVGISDRTALEQLLVQVLAKRTTDEEAVLRAVTLFFNTRAQQIYRQAEAVLAAAAPELPPPILPTPDNASDPGKDLDDADAATEQQKKEAAAEKERQAREAAMAAQQAVETSVQLELTLNTAEVAAMADEDELNNDHTSHAPAISIPYIFTNDYQPISTRQLEQIWRFLRKPSRANTLNPVPDIPRTVERMARHGWLDAPVWQHDKTNKVHLVLLIDHAGSMTAWHSFAQQLVQTARVGGGHRQAEIRWMRNLPTQFVSATKAGVLFKDKSQLQPEPVAEFLRRCSKQDTEVLIFSDAGAARGRLSLERATATAAFVHLLKRHVSSVAWLNPMPANRWWSSSAELIAHQTKMFETNQRGFMALINHLRGQS